MATKQIKLIQDAYIDQGGAPAETYYTAAAKDDNDNDYQVKWEITLSEEDQQKCTDESNMCDWDIYTVIDGSTGKEINAIIID